MTTGLGGTSGDWRGRDLAYDETRQQMYVAGSNGVAVYDPFTDILVNNFAGTSGDLFQHSLDFNTNDFRIYFGGTSGGIQSVDVDTFDTTANVANSAGNYTFNDIAIDQTNNAMFGTGTGTNGAFRLDLDTNQRTFRPQQLSGVTQSLKIEVNGTGDAIYWTSGNGLARRDMDADGNDVGGASGLGGTAGQNWIVGTGSGAYLDYNADNDWIFYGLNDTFGYYDVQSDNLIGLLGHTAHTSDWNNVRFTSTTNVPAPAGFWLFALGVTLLWRARNVGGYRLRLDGIVKP